MRSLKIIIFRDTDKPYTMIISSSALLGIAFSIVALVAFLTFSMLGNILLLSEDSAKGNEPEPARQAAAGAEKPRAGESQQQQGQAPSAEELEATGGDFAGGGEEGEADGAGDDSDVPSPGMVTWQSQSNPFTVSISRGPTISGGMLRFSAAVSNAQEDNESRSGRFVAVLATEDGQLGPTFPSRIEISGAGILNPGRGEPFRIQRFREIEIQFPLTDSEQYSSVVLFLFDEQTKQLLCRIVEPIRR